MDKLRKDIDEGLKKDGKLDMNKLVGKFSIDNDVSSTTVKDYIDTLKNAEMIYIEDGFRGKKTIYRNKEEAQKRQQFRIKIIDDEPK